MKAHLVFPLAVALAALPFQGHAISVLSSTNLAAQDSAEILDYTSNENTLLSTISRTTVTATPGLGYGAQIFTLPANGVLSSRGVASFTFAFGGANITGDTTSASAVIANTTTTGLEVGMAVFGTGIPSGALILTVDSPTQLTLTANATATATAVSLQATGIGATSTLAVDPLGRGFGAVALIPNILTPGAGYSSAPVGTKHNGNTAGKIAFFDYRTATADGSRQLVVLDVGFHPDHVKFTADGKKLVVINEGERTTGGSTDAAGSISVINLSSVTTAALALGQVSALTPAAVSTFDFQAANLGAGVSIAGLRYNEAGLAPADLFKHVEPESCTILGNTVYVTLQENNAIATFDLVTNKWTKISYLGTITQKIDASDRDGPSAGKALKIDDLVAGLPMPDQIGVYQASGVTYLVTANEGDARTDDGDISRLAAATLDGTLAALLPESILGRLNISTRDGDTDTDGDIDVPTMFGTRSFTIWNAATGLKVWDSGSLEPLLAALNPALHNMNDGVATAWDTRSDDKGPEPEALTIGTFGSSTFAFVGLERQNGILVYDVSVPTKPIFMGYQNNSLLTPTVISPESLIFIPADKNATLQPLLISGYEGTGTANTSGIVVHGDVVKYNPDEILVYKLTNSRSWTQEETYYPGTLTPQPRQTRAGIVKDTSYLVFNRNTNQIKTLRYFSRVDDGATIKEYTIDSASYKPWDGVLAAENELEFMETAAPGVGQFTVSFKSGEASNIVEDADLDGDGIMETGKASSMSYLIGAAKPLTVKTGTVSVTLPSVATTMAGKVRQILDADFGDQDGAATDFTPLKQTFYSGAGAQTATLDTVLTTKVLTADPAIGSGLVRGTLDYALFLVKAELDKLGYDPAVIEAP